jgi:uncharacterized membrane protein YgaE (UPF0421/DUF939 family)
MGAPGTNSSAPRVKSFGFRISDFGHFHLQPGWLAWVRRELAPSPGRGAMTLRIVVTTVLVVIISMTLQVPEVLVSAYMVIFVTKENKVVTTLVGILVILGVTIAIAASLLIYRLTFDYPELRVPAIAAVLFTGFFASRILAIGPLGFGIGFFIAATQSIVELVPSAEYLVHSVLWLWVAVTYPIALTVVVTRLMSRPAKSGAAPHPPKPKKKLLAPDAFTNPAHVHFALKVTLAAMACYIIYTGLDWPGIHTSFITVCFISLESIGATLHKGALRLAGCICGGVLGFLSIMYLVPHMESIVSLVLLIAAVAALAGWVAGGSERIAYAGLQIALAFYMCILQAFQPDTDFTKIRDRLAGILLGIGVTTFVFRYFWPEEAGEPAGAAR